MTDAPRTLVLASGNAGKLREMSALLEPLGYVLRPQSDWDFPEAVEDGETFVENAILKARHAARHTGLPALADDSGLVVPALGGAPGVHSARYAGRHGDDAANNRRLLEVLDEQPGIDRRAHFYCAMALFHGPEDPAPLVATGRWHGAIAAAPRGEGGFGYDPLFLVPDRGCTSAELSPELKNRLSHRGRAAAALCRMIRDDAVA